MKFLLFTLYSGLRTVTHMVCNGGKLYVFVHRQNIQILTKNDLPDKIKMPPDGGGALGIKRGGGPATLCGGGA